MDANEVEEVAQPILRLEVETAPIRQAEGESMILGEKKMEKMSSRDKSTLVGIFVLQIIAIVRLSDVSC